MGELADYKKFIEIQNSVRVVCETRGDVVGIEVSFLEKAMYVADLVNEKEYTYHALAKTKAEKEANKAFECFWSNMKEFMRISADTFRFAQKMAVIKYVMGKDATVNKMFADIEKRISVLYDQDDTLLEGNDFLESVHGFEKRFQRKIGN